MRQAREVEVAQHLTPAKGAIPPPISPVLLKHIKHEIIKPVTLILNQCLTTGIFPDKLKIAKLVRIYKSDDENIFNN